MSVVLNWNGKDFPEELRVLPQGRYVLESVDTLHALTPGEEDSLEQGLESIRQGRTVSMENVRARLDGILKR